MYIRRGQRVVPYLYVAEWGHSDTIELKDKVIIKYLDHTVTGIVQRIGTKNIILRISGMTLTSNRQFWSVKTIPIVAIRKIRKYPKCSQTYTNIKLGK